jgi:hypothetical protein
VQTPGSDAHTAHAMAHTVTAAMHASTAVAEPQGLLPTGLMQMHPPSLCWF